jgi:hypothetical protein
MYSVRWLQEKEVEVTKKRIEAMEKEQKGLPPLDD